MLSSRCSHISIGSGFTEKGSLWVAQTSDRLHTLKRQYAIINAIGINCQILNVEKFKEKVPLIDPHEVWVSRREHKKKQEQNTSRIEFVLSRVVFG